MLCQQVIYGLQQRELELSQEKEELLSELTLPSPRRCELEREVHQLKVASQERRQALLETQQHLQASDDPPPHLEVFGCRMWRLFGVLPPRLLRSYVGLCVFSALTGAVLSHHLDQMA